MSVLENSAIYSNPTAGLTITNTPENLVLKLPLSLNDTYNQYLSGAGGSIRETTSNDISWTLPKNELTYSMLQTMTGQDIKSQVPVSTAPNSINVGGMSFPSELTMLPPPPTTGFNVGPPAEPSLPLPQVKPKTPPPSLPVGPPLGGLQLPPGYGSQGLSHQGAVPGLPPPPSTLPGLSAPPSAQSSFPPSALPGLSAPPSAQSSFPPSALPGLSAPPSAQSSFPPSAQSSFPPSAPPQTFAGLTPTHPQYGNPQFMVTGASQTYQSPYLQQQGPREAKRLIGGSREEGFLVYDYSEKSIAVFLERSLYDNGWGNYMYTNKLGKEENLYPDGGTSSRKGYIMAKSNAACMKFVSDLLRKDIKTLADFSYTQKNGYGAYSRPQVTGLTGPATLTPQIATGPFPMGYMSVPGSLPLPTITPPIPGIPAPNIQKNLGQVLFASLKDIKGLDVLESYEEPDGDSYVTLFAGPTELVSQAELAYRQKYPSATEVFKILLGNVTVIEYSRAVSS